MSRELPRRVGPKKFTPLVCEAEQIALHAIYAASREQRLGVSAKLLMDLFCRLPGAVRLGHWAAGSLHELTERDRNLGRNKKPPCCRRSAGKGIEGLRQFWAHHSQTRLSGRSHLEWRKVPFPPLGGTPGTSVAAPAWQAGTGDLHRRCCQWSICSHCSGSRSRPSRGSELSTRWLLAVSFAVHADHGAILPSDLSSDYTSESLAPNAKGIQRGCSKLYSRTLVRKAPVASHCPVSPPTSEREKSEPTISGRPNESERVRLQDIQAFMEKYRGGKANVMVLLRRQ